MKQAAEHDVESESIAEEVREFLRSAMKYRHVGCLAIAWNNN